MSFISPHNTLAKDDYLQLVNATEFSRGMQNFIVTGVIDPHNTIVFVGYTPSFREGLLPKKRLKAAKALQEKSPGSPPFKDYSGQALIEVVRELNRVKKEFPYKRFTLVFGKTDRRLSPDHLEIIPSNVVRIFACNIDYESPIIQPIPMGRDFRLATKTYRSQNKSVATKYRSVNFEKSISCYANFSVNTHSTRKLIAEACHHNPTINSQDLGSRFRRYTLSYPEYLEKLARSKFVICPRGNGVDSFRFWDSLYFGCIPVVTDDRLYRLLPIQTPCIKLSIEQIRNMNFKELEEDCSHFWQAEYQKQLAQCLSTKTWQNLLLNNP
jgi:hypothetical protein